MRRIYKLFGSLRVGIALLLTITILSLIGVIIPQELEPQRYINKWGNIAGRLIVQAGVDRIFSTPWYNAVLALLGLNVMLCTIERMKAIFFFLTKPLFLTADKIEKIKRRIDLQIRYAPDEAASKIYGFFRKRRLSTSVSKQTDGILIDARGGKIRGTGSALLHLCLIPLLLGGLIGRMKGFSYMQELGAGEIAPVRNRSFSVLCEFFRIERTGKGEIKDYKSSLFIIDSLGDTLAHKIIEVNHPLKYDGIKFYQSSYREDPWKIGDIDLVVTGPLIGPIGRKVRLQPGRSAVVPGTGISVTADRFMPDFYYDIKTKTPHNRSEKHNNPALFVTITKDADTLFARWVFRRFGAMHHEEETYGASFLSYEPALKTGLLIKENPGHGLVWVGIIGMSVGIFMIFWGRRSRYCAAIVDSGEGAVRVVVGYMNPREEPDSLSLLETLSEYLTYDYKGRKLD